MHNSSLYARLKKLTLLSLCCLSWQACLAEEKGMASAMRESGKIYVVVGVVVLIFIGLLIYLIRLDRKIGKLEAYREKENEKEK